MPAARADIGTSECDVIPGEVKRLYDSEAFYGALIKDGCAFTGYRDEHEIAQHAQTFMTLGAKAESETDADWYRRFGKERVARQLWFNTASPHKRAMTEFLLSSVNGANALRVLGLSRAISAPSVGTAQP
jgi:hypothetical protein